MAGISEAMVPKLEVVNRTGNDLDTVVSLTWQGFELSLCRSQNDARMIVAIDVDTTNEDADDQLVVDINDDRVFG